MYSKTKTFLYRFFYTFKLIWDTSPAIYLLKVLTTLFNGLQPVVAVYLTKLIVDAIVAGIRAGDFQPYYRRIIFYVVLQIGILFIKFVITNISQLIDTVFGDILASHIRIQIMNKAKDVDYIYFDMPEFYNSMENANREAGYRPMSIMSNAFGFLSTLITFLGFAAVISRYSVLVMLLVIILSIPASIVDNRFRKKIFSIMSSKSKERRKLDYIANLLTLKDYAKEVRLFDLGGYFIGRYLSVFKEYIKDYSRVITWQSIYSTIALAVSFLSVGVASLMIGADALRGKISIGDFTMYFGALTDMRASLNSILFVSGFLYEGMLFMGNLISFLKGAPQTSQQNSKVQYAPLKKGQHTIEFVDVSFKYPGSDRYALKNINLKIDPGQTVALVGLNGAGKTTLIKLMIGLYDPTEGRILIDGKDIKEYNRKELQSIFGVVFQDFCHYAFTLGENIGFGKIENVEDEDMIREAAKKCGVDEFAEKLPKGYKTHLTRNFELDGVDLSIGQWQKVSIARAFFRQADVLILDEPTASLDPQAEYEVYQQFEQLKGDKTTVFVSHRLSSTTLATKIIFLDNGKIKEIGNHQQLMEKNGEYAKLFKMQAERYQDKKAVNA
ncbi:ATP-binding cassette, subfamily B [Caldanaerobius fijiensis DSM 17918]|uniref:ATP-binding cassette, subfamily B n=1 Tax=Caldanaerobius fijiensis DSM 17918 TaxID=1121256 RepID=A0A1M5E2L0_9THEO|nr:ABC transporter ATP-binding protein [Caldanaerobius fijiensis]SHF73463.1 ATP-binding cassette, subfamily B [Caldanaerobius fijiensis DSM 17918]